MRKRIVEEFQGFSVSEFQFLPEGVGQIRGQGLGNFEF
jgi:hypothetical protein